MSDIRCESCGEKIGDRGYCSMCSDATPDVPDFDPRRAAMALADVWEMAEDFAEECLDEEMTDDLAALANYLNELAGPGKENP